MTFHSGVESQRLTDTENLSQRERLWLYVWVCMRVRVCVCVCVRVCVCVCMCVRRVRGTKARICLSNRLSSFSSPRISLPFRCSRIDVSPLAIGFSIKELPSGERERGETSFARRFFFRSSFVWPDTTTQVPIIINSRPSRRKAR